MAGDAEIAFKSILAVGGTNWRVHPMSVSFGSRPVGLARTPVGRPALLVPAPPQPAQVLMVTRGIVARIGALESEGGFSDWLMLTCMARHFDDNFYRLCDALLEDLGDAGEGSDQVAVTMAGVEQWRGLFADDSSGLLSDARCAGLLAELHVMEDLCSRVGPVSALASWAGPDKARVDFRFNSAGIEVKATSGLDRFKVTVHGLWQLDESEVGDLFLVAQQLEAVHDGGDSLPDAVARLVAGGVSKPELVKHLAAVGYRQPDEEVYDRVRFKLLDQRAVQVIASTPRIVKSSFADPHIAESLSSVSYQLDLTDLAPAQGRLANVDEVYEGVAG